MANDAEILQQLKANANDVGTPNSVYLTLASWTAIDIGAGAVQGVYFLNPSNPTLSLWDNASGASNTAIAVFGAGLPAGSYVLDKNYTNVLTSYFGLGNAPSVLIKFR